MLNTWTWVFWLVSALAAVWSTRNPFYLCILLLAMVMVWRSVEKRVKEQYTEGSTWVPFSPIRISIYIIFFSVLINGLISHFGNTVLFQLPQWIPYLGGPITLEALVFGAINGLVLSGILIGFMTVNLSLPVRSLLRLIPHAFYPLAVVTSIAITFLPNSTRQIQQIREAQAIRGHRIKGFKDWLPLIMPLLIGGLERAMGLAETMTARGFAGDKAEQQGSTSKWGIILGLLLFLSGWLLQLINPLRMVGLITAGFGLGLIIYSIWHSGRRTPRTHYRREEWTASDAFVITGCVVMLCIYFLPLPWIERSSLSYNPYPLLFLPEFDPVIGLASMLLAIPAILIKFRTKKFPDEVG